MTRKSVSKLADEIFKLVEREQGYAFLCDGLGALRSRHTLFAVVRGCLKHTNASARILRAWLKKYGQLH